MGISVLKSCVCSVQWSTTASHQCAPKLCVQCAVEHYSSTSVFSKVVCAVCSGTLQLHISVLQSCVCSVQWSTTASHQYAPKLCVQCAVEHYSFTSVCSKVVCAVCSGALQLRISVLQSCVCSVHWSTTASHQCAPKLCVQCAL